jgi:hypothetical protein
MGNGIPRDKLAAMLNSILENNKDWQYHPGVVLRRRRQDLGVTPQQVGEWSDSTRKTIDNIETKDECHSSWQKVVSALNVLGVQVYFRVVDDEADRVGGND